MPPFAYANFPGTGPMIAIVGRNAVPRASDTELVAGVGAQASPGMDRPPHGNSPVMPTPSSPQSGALHSSWRLPRGCSPFIGV